MNTNRNTLFLCFSVGMSVRDFFAARGPQKNPVGCPPKTVLLVNFQWLPIRCFMSHSEPQAPPENDQQDELIPANSIGYIPGDNRRYSSVPGPEGRRQIIRCQSTSQGLCCSYECRKDRFMAKWRRTTLLVVLSSTIGILF